MTRPALALLPPLGHDSALFRSLTMRLGDAWDVHALDYPGFGARAHVTLPALRGRAPDDRARLALLDALADDVLEQLRERAIVPDVLGGVSLGGTLSLVLRDRLPRPPRVLLLMASGGRRVASVRKAGVRAAMDALGDLPFARQHLGLDESEGGADQHYGVVTPEVDAYRAHLRDAVWSGPGVDDRARAAVAMLDAALAVDCEDTMRTNSVPALVVAGTHDRIFTPRYVARYGELLAASQIHLLPGVGHYPPLEAPDEVTALLRRALPHTSPQP